MGTRANYLLAKADPMEICNALSLGVLSTVEEKPSDGLWAARLTPSGWTVVMSDDLDFLECNGDGVVDLSWHCTVLTVCEHDVVMCSDVTCRSLGETEWRITYEARHDDHRQNLTVAGEPPGLQEEIDRADEKTRNPDRGAKLAAALFGGVDYHYSIGTRIMSDLTGFRPGYTDTFEQVERYLILSEPKLRGRA